MDNIQFVNSYYWNNQDKCREYQRGYYWNNRDRILAYQKFYYQINKDIIKQKRRMRNYIYN